MGDDKDNKDKLIDKLQSYIIELEEELDKAERQRNRYYLFLKGHHHIIDNLPRSFWDSENDDDEDSEVEA